MTGYVRFRAGAGEYAIPVDRAREVRRADGMTQLPATRHGVAGFLPLDGTALAVMGVLAPHGGHVIVLEDHARPFGLLVDDVTSVIDVRDEDLGPAPAGQSSQLVHASMHEGDVVVLVVDVAALWRGLEQ